MHSSAISCIGIMAECKKSTSYPSPASEMTSLTRALSHSRLSQLDQSDVFKSQTSFYRSNVAQPGRRRRLSSSNSVESLDVSPCAEARVLVINTGGTIGMMYHNNVLSPEPNAFVKALRKLPILHDEQYALQTRMYDYYSTSGPQENTLVLPMPTHLADELSKRLCKQNKRIVYTVLEYSPLLDSCNMTTDDWATIGKDIEKHYEKYDGFVILHGTDTMAYTASALSFMCEHLGKPVILTGSQVPIYEMRNDGRDNLLGALLIAGQFVIPEVCLYFHNKLYRGNRVTKVDSGSFNAFNSPNLAPLANAEVDIKINWDTVWRANTTSRFRVSTQMNRNVGLLRLFPGITAMTVKSFLQAPMEGIVLETYGSGNAPDNRADLLEEFRNATERGVIMVNCTQCLRGSVTTSYATGKALSDAGLVAGCDMTPEAALCKLSYVLARTDLNKEAKIKMLSQNLRGEMIADLQGAKLTLSDSRFIQVIAKSLSISCKEELEAVRDALTPTLACAASKVGDVEALDAIKEMGSNLSLGDYDGRTPLHIASCEGHLKVVQYLLSQGATVYAKDRYGDTPLRNAVRFRHKEVVKLLRKTGAHFSRDELEDAGSELCSLAASADIEGLEMWHLAGGDLDTPGYDGQTPMEVAKAVGNEVVIDFLHQVSQYHAQNGEYIEFSACPKES
ncbi:60 kDa lysophospholipase isoform X2 [Salmo salar]|uniref:asparaginase n=1 Tax=Salmo salar TaxID=8030 RepID=A0A1S3QQG5_SALSA|nr:60 kDa lysophospholipase isoform X2 [Salmo salar]|eukprot:XP_014042300.1 PREDICTED: 60 kDa lysophospholipase-like isoform X4 [Salmo salar]